MKDKIPKINAKIAGFLCAVIFFTAFALFSSQSAYAGLVAHDGTYYGGGNNSGGGGDYIY